MNGRYTCIKRVGLALFYNFESMEAVSSGLSFSPSSPSPLNSDSVEGRPYSSLLVPILSVFAVLVGDLSKPPWLIAKMG